MIHIESEQRSTSIFVNLTLNRDTLFVSLVLFFFFNDTATTEIYTLSLHDALPIWLRRDAVQPDIEAERKKRDEIEAGKSYCSRRFGGATCDDKSAQIYARFDKNDWRIQPAEFYRFHDAEVNTFGYF